jgi:hypothetical protein
MPLRSISILHQSLHTTAAFLARRLLKLAGPLNAMRNMAVHAVNCHKVTGEMWLQGEPQLKPSSVQRKTKRKEKTEIGVADGTRRLRIPVVFRKN